MVMDFFSEKEVVKDVGSFGSVKSGALFAIWQFRVNSKSSQQEMGGKIKAGKCKPHVLDSNCRGQTLQSQAIPHSPLLEV